MRAGPLDRRIQILRATITTDAMNTPVETWVLLVTVWASKRDVSDGERFKSGTMNASRMTRFQIRHSSQVATVNPKDRVVFEGLTYDIIATKELDRRDGIEITAAARTDGG
jgi:SPP1 family predicted phage head-tail adaptor